MATIFQQWQVLVHLSALAALIVVNAKVLLHRKLTAVETHL